MTFHLRFPHEPTEGRAQAWVAGTGQKFRERVSRGTTQRLRSETLRQMNLECNGDGTLVKLGETLTGVSINKPLIRKKEAERVERVQ